MLDLFSVGSYICFMGLLGVRLLRHAYDAADFVVTGVSAVLAYVFADFLSGLVHWAGDTFFKHDTPVIGAAFIRPFREHHLDPKAITNHTFLETNGNNCLAMLGLLMPLWFVGRPAPGSTAVPFFWFQIFAFFVSLAVFATNQFHKWAHQDDPLALVRWLQRAGLILPPHRHDIHHTAPHDKSYCITVGWLNPWLDRTRLFERSERVLRSVFRRPKRPNPLA